MALLPDEAEPKGLLALMLLSDAARTTPDGELVLLEDQDRDLWDAAAIQEGLALVARMPWAPAPGAYALQAAIAAEHAKAARAADTDWRAIAELYAALLRVRPSPVVELNRAVAVAMAEGCEAGLALVAEIEARGELPSYYLLPATRADLLRRLGRRDEAAAAYRRALDRVGTAPERRFLERRLREVESGAG